MKKETIFLNVDQTLDAICRDFRQYEPQVILFAEALRLIEHGRATFKREPGQKGIWLKTSGSNRMRWLEGSDLVAYMCAAVERLKQRNNLDLLATVASRVFQDRCRPAQDTDTQDWGLDIETGMEQFVCRQCGQCCWNLDYHAELLAEDVARWRARGRSDILDWVGVTRHKDGRETYQIWVTPGTNRFASPCPFLYKVPTSNHWVCRIHEDKPQICCNYPVSRKHARMTGCPGFDK
jgi:Fe-S-cluster containining protein